MSKPRVQRIVESKYGVCLWEIEDDSHMFLNDGEDRYLSLEGKLGDIQVEQRIREAAKSYLGDLVEKGRPVWLPEHRQCSDMEYDDQVARLADGKVPDEVDLVKQVLRGNK